MQFIQIPICSHPLFEEIEEAMSSFVLTNEKVETAGDWSVGHTCPDLIPSKDLDLPSSYKRANLQKLSLKLQSMAIFYGAMVRAAMFYPAGGGLGWHTNSAHPGVRAYVAKSSGEGSGIQLPEKFVSDRPGFVNVFRITPNWNDCWHAVKAVVPRMSVGICFPPDFADFDKLSAHASSI